MASDGRVRERQAATTQSPGRMPAGLRPLTLGVALALACAGGPSPGAAPGPPDPGERPAPSPAAKPAPAASEAWLARARRGLAAREYRASRNRRGLQAPNRAHDLRTYFEPTGIRVHDRTAAGSPALLGLALAGMGRGERLAEPAPGTVASKGARVEIRRGPLLEWYENSERGLEQGFTLSERPVGAGPLAIELAVEDATPSLRGDAVVFATPTGRKLRYGKLHAWDAEERILPASLDVTPAGRVRLEIDDAGATYPVVVDPLLTETADAQLEADQAQAWYGASVASAGDVDGSGSDDLIIGAPFFDAGESNEGAVFVFRQDLGTVAQLESDQAGSNFGFSVASAGDVNGDGYGDLIVGALGHDAAEGAAFVFLGSASGIVGDSAANAATRLEGDQGSSGFGYSVAGAGDVDGDGYADVIVGADFYDAGIVDAGAAFVFLGSATGVADAGGAAAATTLESDDAQSLFGRSVASAGDVNGDGHSDVIVGAPGYADHDQGRAFVFLGSASGIADAISTAAHAQIEPQGAGARLGASVASAGDVDGDGYADVILGAEGEDSAYVFLGSATGIAGGTTATADTRLQGDAGGPLGSSVASAGDVDGDGYADVIVGARLYDAGETDEGAAFVFLGSGAGIPDGGPATAYAQLESDQTDSDFGHAVASAGDLDGDGYADIVVGARYFDAGETDEGAAFVYYGGAESIPDGTPATAHARLESDQEGAGLAAASSAGDVNGDGFSDVIVGASDYDAGETDEGAAFLFLGGPAGIADAGFATAHARLEGDQADAWFGGSVASAGDVNGDGFADVVVGAFLYDAGQTDEGAAFVFLGGPAGMSDGSPATAHARLEADLAGSRLGLSVASAGDVNGDGYADVIVGAPLFESGEFEEGAAFVFHGSAAGIASGGPASADGTVNLNLLGAQLGTDVASAGDVNGDGFADLVVGGPLLSIDIDLLEAGGFWVFAGGPEGILGDVDDPQFPSLILGATGDQSQAWLGSSVASAGDVDGDGRADVVVGAPQYDAGETDEGAAFVFLGGSFVQDLSDAAARLESDQAGARLGGDVASAGDVNGDGFADVLVGADGLDTGPTAEGAALLFLGNGNRDGRTVAARQLRGDASGLPVQPWGSAGAPDVFAVRMTAAHPAGRGAVKLEVERCAPGVDFGALSCAHFVSPSWADVGATGEVELTESIPIPFGDLLARWRARVLRAPLGVTQPGITAPPNPAHGPWRRLFAQAVEADVRRQMTAAEGVPGGMGTGASALGGVGTFGGVEATFADTTGGTLSVGFAPAPVDEDLADLLDAPASIDFQLPADPVLLWEIDYDGSFSGEVTLTFQYDEASLLIPETELRVEHFENGSWVPLPKVAQDLVADTITVTTTSLSPFALAGGSGGSGNWEFSGTAQGGSIAFTVGAVFLSVTTTSGQTAEQAAAAVAAAINGDATLAAAGITATADGAVVETNGTVTSSTVDDPGLAHEPVSTEIPVLPGAALLVLGAALCVAARRRLARA